MLQKMLDEQCMEFSSALSPFHSSCFAFPALDKQIKSFNVGPNPYTWFTMEALEDTWKNLQKIIKVRILNSDQYTLTQVKLIEERQNKFLHSSCVGA